MYVLLEGNSIVIVVQSFILKVEVQCQSSVKSKKTLTDEVVLDGYEASASTTNNCDLRPVSQSSFILTTEAIFP